MAPCAENTVHHTFQLPEILTMKAFKFLFLLTALAALHSRGAAQDFAPANLSSMLFNGAITSATGGANASGVVSSLFASNGVDYTLAPSGMLSDPVPFSYIKNNATTATFTEMAVGSLPGVSVALTFSSATAGNFVATYTNNSTQQGTFTLTPIGFSPVLTNVSTRTSLAANGTATVGFVIGGAGPRRLLIRAVGPGLEPFGVSSRLTNPSIMLWRGSQQIGANDDYATGQNVDTTLPATFTRVGAFTLPAGSRDAALVQTLEPGAYTAQIRGGTTTEAGEVLLEVYFLD
jgi:hypothetical protein